MTDILWLVKYRHHKLGLERSTIVVQGTPYMTRYILHAGLFSLRLHRFHTGDGDRESHDHPFWFVTFPLMDYFEETEYGTRLVKAFRFHYRDREFKHRVVGSVKQCKYGAWYGLPFWTIVLTGPYHDSWGFYDEYGNYTPYQEHEEAASATKGAKE